MLVMVKNTLINIFNLLILCYAVFKYKLIMYFVDT